MFDAQGTRIGGPQEEFPAIAYSLMVACDGAVYLCHDLDTRCWHSGAVVSGVARNASHVGIAIINDGSPSEGQLDGLVEAIIWVTGQVGRQLSLEGHKDAPYQTTCPGPDWAIWKGELSRKLYDRAMRGL